jgi:hypothetical protein
MYTNYLNDGRPGCTWATLVATAIHTDESTWLTCRAIAEEIWQKANPPDSLMAQINTTLNKLIDANMVVWRAHPSPSKGSARYAYALTTLGASRVAAPEMPWCDSELFHEGRKKKIHRRHNVVRFRKVG